MSDTLPQLPVIFTDVPARSPVVPGPPSVPERPTVALTIDGVAVTAPEGATILEACRAQGGDLPTLCYSETLDPAAVCRMCVVETGGRTLTPACFAKVADGMEVRTDTERVRTSRKLLLELLASSVDVDLAGPALPDRRIHDWMEEYGADPGRFGPPAPPAEAGERDRRHAGHHGAPATGTAETVHQPTKVDNELYVRDYAKCILCAKCTDACGVGAQNTFAIAIAGRGDRKSTRLNSSH